MFVVDKKTGLKLLDMNCNGRLSETQVSLLTMLCATRMGELTDFLFLREVQDPGFKRQLGCMKEAMAAARSMYESSNRLTVREQQVLRGLLKGMANKEIGSELNLTERTVKFHVSSLFVKFKVKTRNELATSRWLFGSSTTCSACG